MSLAKGVTDQFLRILDNERKLAVRHGAIGAALALALLFMANLADEPLFGTESFVYVVTLFLGIGSGVGLAWWRSRRVGDSLKNGWNAWMRFSVSSATVEEVYRKATNRRPPTTTLPALGAAALLVANGLLFALLWVEAGVAGGFALLMVVLNGAYVGVFLGAAAFRFGWARSFDRALQEMLREGAIGIWGER